MSWRSSCQQALTAVNGYNMDLLTSWLEPAFMKRALFALVALSPACAAMGVHVVQARLAYFSDAIAHSAFTGIAIGLALGLSPTATLIAFAVAVAVAIVFVKATGRLPTDTVIGVFLSTSVAVGLALVSYTRQTNRFSQYLFGDPLAVTDAESAAAAALCAGVFFFLGLFGNRLLLVGLSDTLAQAERIPARALELAFAVLLAVLTAIAVRFVGALLVTALLLVPAAAARQAAISVSGNFWLAVGLGLASSVLGLFASFHLAVSTGAAIVLTMVSGFIACSIVGRIRRGTRN
jgi:zinc transport system permease protein